MGVVLLFLLLIALVLGVVEASKNDKLGPIVWSSGTSGSNIQILSPQKNGTTSNPVQLHFCAHVRAWAWYWEQAYPDVGVDIGYSIDNGDIYRVNEFYKQRKTPDGDLVTVEFWANITLPNITEGTHTITVYYGTQYSGTASNPSLKKYIVIAYSTVEFTVKNKDTTPPNITVESPTHNTTYTDEIQLTFAINETATQVNYSIDGNENITIQANNFNITLVDLTEGTHNITVYAEDKEGNIGASKTITFNIAAPKLEPFPTLTIATVTHKRDCSDRPTSLLQKNTNTKTQIITTN